MSNTFKLTSHLTQNLLFLNQIHRYTLVGILHYPYSYGYITIAIPLWIYYTTPVEKYDPYTAVYGEIRYVNGAVFPCKHTASNTPVCMIEYGNITASLRRYTVRIRLSYTAVILAVCLQGNTTHKRPFTVGIRRENDRLR